MTCHHYVKKISFIKIQIKKYRNRYMADYYYADDLSLLSPTFT